MKTAVAVIVAMIVLYSCTMAVIPAALYEVDKAVRIGQLYSSQVLAK